MSREFNYQRANEEWAAPQVQLLSSPIHRLWDRTIDCSEYLGQDKSLGVPFKSTIDEPEAHQVVEELERAFTECDPDELATAAVVIHCWGHWGFTKSVTVIYPGLTPREFVANGDPFSPDREAKQWVTDMNKYPPAAPKDAVQFVPKRVGPSSQDTGGAYWKFQKLVITNLIARGEWNVDREEKRVNKRLGFDTEDFMDHKPGTDWSLDEMPFLFREHFGDAFKVVDAITCNHDPHPFVIGHRHLQGDSMYIRPDSAPCAMRDCNLKYSQHKSDTALVLKCLRAVPEKEAKDLMVAAEPLMNEHGITGFAFAPGDFKIVTEEEDGVRNKKTDIE